MPRLFVGSFLEGPEAERISTITSARANQFSSEALPHKAKDCKIRALPKEKLHMTWLFLGEVKSNDIEELTKKFVVTIEQLKNTLSRCAFEINYDHLSLWPSEDKARVAVLCPSAPPPEVAIIDSEIRAALSDFQENEEVYPEFNPHLTVFRISPAADLRATNLLQIRAIQPLLPIVPKPEGMTDKQATSPDEQPILPDEQPILLIKQTISINGIRLIESENGYTIIA